MSWSDKVEPCRSTLEDPLSPSTSRMPRSRLYHGTWPLERDSWSQNGPRINELSGSVMSFNGLQSDADQEEVHGDDNDVAEKYDVKKDMILSLLGMLMNDNSGQKDTSNTLLSLSTSVENCLLMRQSGCISLLVRLIHAPNQEESVRRSAGRALYNIVRFTENKKQNRQELHILTLVEQLREYSTSFLLPNQPRDQHPLAALSDLTKLSYVDVYRHTICLMGGLYAIAELIETDCKLYTPETANPSCLAVRKYCGKILTNLTFGDSKNKSLLCSFPGFLSAWVSQLKSPHEDAHQVTASVLRNLSWRADNLSKRHLRESGTVRVLMEAAIRSKRESILKAILSALWNLSAHCARNKSEICGVQGALNFLVELLDPQVQVEKPSLAVVENAGGILRNVSSHVAVEENYRQILRKKGTLQVLVRLLTSPSLTVVSNVCGTLWNLSARNAADQKTLWDLGTVQVLRTLVHSQHKMISMGASATLRNLLSARQRTFVSDNFEDGDQPINYSKKYLEQKRGDYAETDLDQPTDYSLRYADQEREDDLQPDVTKTYCTEGTPYDGTPRNFSTATSMSDLRDPQAKKDKEEFYPLSRVNSLSSLTSNAKDDLSPGDLPEQKQEQEQEQEQEPEKDKDKEQKVVTFKEDFDDKETPLMFSRSSSLGSLSGCEANSVDDHSSIISDFSRRTSGIISPSELPDSPTQTVPPSPRKKKRGVFEDQVANFKEENTPLEFSNTTSLSSLTIDDDPKEEGKGEGQKVKAGLMKEEQGSDEDEEILKACINIGMRHHRVEVASNLIRYQTSATLDRLSDDSPKKGNVSMDSVHVYCTEDTPAEISPVGSQSNLSALSMPSILEDRLEEEVGQVEEEEEEEENGDGDGDGSLAGTEDSEDDEILDQCIASGMSKCISPSAEAFLKRREFNNDEEEEDEEEEEGNNSFDSEEDDDAILAECIESAMPKGRVLNDKPMTSRQDVQNFDPKSPSVGSLSLSEDEEENILAECIRSAVPKVSNINYLNEERRYPLTETLRTFSPRQMKSYEPVVIDETANFATEDTPCNFSVISEISNLSFNSTSE